MTALPLDAIIPFGTRVMGLGRNGEASEWCVGEAVRMGGSSVVYKVFERHRPCRFAAMKVLRPDKPELAANIIRETDAFRSRLLGRHGPEFHACGFLGGLPFIIMEWADPAPRNVPVGRVMPIVDGMTASVTLLHERKLCHGDLKPGNVGLVNGEVKLLDLGSLRSFLPGESDGPLLLTPGYCAPEQLEGDCATPWADVYGIAATLAELLSADARAAFSKTLLDGMNPRAERRIDSPDDFRRAMADCFRTFRRNRLRTLVSRTLSFVLTVSTTAATCMQIVSSEKRRTRIEAVRGWETAAASLACLRAGARLCHEGHTNAAVRCFRDAADLGSKEARDILDLMDRIRAR